MPTAKPASSRADAARRERHAPVAGEQQPQCGKRPDGDPGDQQGARGEREADRQRAAGGRSGDVRPGSAGGPSAAPHRRPQPGAPAGGGDAGRRRAGGGGRRGVGGLGRPGLGGRPVERSGIRCCGRPMSLCRIAVPWGRGNGLRHLPTLPASRACGNGRPRSLVRGPVARKGNVDVSYRGTCCTPRARRAAGRGSATPPSATVKRIGTRRGTAPRRSSRRRRRPARTRRPDVAERARPSASVVSEATMPPSARSSTATPAAGRPRTVSSTWVREAHSASSSRSRAIFAISPSAVSISCSRVLPRRRVRVRQDRLRRAVLAHADHERDAELLAVGRVRRP